MQESDTRKNDVPLRPDPTGVDTGESPMLDDDMQDNLPQADQGRYATTQELLNFGTPVLPGSVMEEWPGLYYTQKEAEGKPDWEASANYRSIPVVGGFTNCPAPGRLAGLNINDASAGGNTAAYVRLHDGQDANAPVIVAVRVLAGTSKELNFQNLPRFRYGIFVEVVSGTIEGVIYLAQYQVT